MKNSIFGFLSSDYFKREEKDFDKKKKKNAI